MPLAAHALDERIELSGADLWSAYDDEVLTAAGGRV
jgi:hypothetical protein